MQLASFICYSMGRILSLRNIIIIMATALTLLTAMQVYLLVGAYQGENERFEQSVKEALLNVRYRVERSHIEQQISRQLDVNAIERDLINSIDSIQSGRSSNGEVQEEYMQEMPSGFYNDLQGSNAQVSDISGQEAGRLIERFDGNMEMLEKNPDQLKSIFKDLLFGYLSFNNRDIQIAMIDSALKEELSMRGIKADYEFGIYNSFNNSFRYAQTANSADYIYSEYQTPLYYIGQRNAIILSVHFPHKTNYIVGNIFFLLVSAFLVILVIIGLFIYSIRIIYQQRRISEMKNDLINNITHELKTPISIISLACQALNDEDMAKIEGIRTNYLNMIAQENKRLGSLVENILQSAVMEKGDFKMKFKKLNANERIDAALKSFKMRLSEKNFNVTVNIETDPLIVEADETHFTNMIFNLIDNAIKYSKPGDKNPAIHIGTYSKDGNLYITVEDNGIGISKEDQKKIFEKLFRVSTGNVHNVKGYGLGLNYVQSIVERHKGEIHVKSELGKGTLFSVKMPLTQ